MLPDPVSGCRVVALPFWFADRVGPGRLIATIRSGPQVPIARDYPMEKLPDPAPPPGVTGSVGSHIARQADHNPSV